MTPASTRMERHEPRRAVKLPSPSDHLSHWIYYSLQNGQRLNSRIFNTALPGRFNLNIRRNKRHATSIGSNPSGPVRPRLAPMPPGRAFSRRRRESPIRSFELIIARTMFSFPRGTASKAIVMGGPTKLLRNINRFWLDSLCSSYCKMGNATTISDHSWS